MSDSTTGPARPCSIWSRNEPTRFMKNSSRLLEKMERKRIRSNNGVPESLAMSNTRRLNSSHSKSRFKNRAGSVRAVRAVNVLEGAALASTAGSSCMRVRFNAPPDSARSMLRIAALQPRGLPLYAHHWATARQLALQYEAPQVPRLD